MVKLNTAYCMPDGQCYDKMVRECVTKGELTDLSSHRIEQWNFLTPPHWSRDVQSTRQRYLKNSKVNMAAADRAYTHPNSAHET